MLAANETVNWYPPPVKHGRPAARVVKNPHPRRLGSLRASANGGTRASVACPQGHVHVIGSFRES